MKSDTYLKMGTLLFGISILAMGLIHLITGNFPNSFIPLTRSFPGKSVLADISGVALVIAGSMILLRRFAKTGAIIAASIFVIILALVHIPLLATNIYNGGEWTQVFEHLSILSGLLILLGFARVGQYIFAAGLCVFGIVHLIYEQYIISWIPVWLPSPVFWTYLVPVAFFCAFVSLATRKMVRLSSLLLALMFFIFAIAVNLPRAIHIKLEVEWTGIFTALSMSGISLMIAAKNSLPSYSSPEASRPRK